MVEKTCASCGNKSLKAFAKRTETIEHKGFSKKVTGLSGRECTECSEIYFDLESARRYGEAGDELVLSARKQKAAELKRIRKHLGLSQKQASELSGGGHNAFSRYEKGLAEPMAATINLFRALEIHPELISRLMIPIEIDGPHIGFKKDASKAFGMTVDKPGPARGAAAKPRARKTA